MQIEENLIVCFSDNSYDNCHPTRIELSLINGEIKRNSGIDRDAVIFVSAQKLLQKNFYYLKIILCIRRKRYKSKTRWSELLTNSKV